MIATKGNLSSGLKEILSSLKHKVKDQFINNPALIYIKSSEHSVTDPSGIEFNIKIMESLNSKPEGEKTHFGSSTAQKEKKNPFLPPFEEGQFITDLLHRHRLIYNKYCVCDNHVLVITKDFEH